MAIPTTTTPAEMLQRNNNNNNFYDERMTTTATNQRTCWTPTHYQPPFQLGGSDSGCCDVNENNVSLDFEHGRGGGGGTTPSSTPTVFHEPPPPVNLFDHQQPPKTFSDILAEFHDGEPEAEVKSIESSLDQSLSSKLSITAVVRLCTS